MELSWATISAILAGYILIDTAYSKLKERINPAANIPTRIKTLEYTSQKYLKERQEVAEQFTKIEETNKLQCKAMLDIMLHMRDGNHVENMNKTIKEIEDILIDI